MLREEPFCFVLLRCLLTFTALGFFFMMFAALLVWSTAVNKRLGTTGAVDIVALSGYTLPGNIFLPGERTFAANVTNETTTKKDASTTTTNTTTTTKKPSTTKAVSLQASLHGTASIIQFLLPLNSLLKLLSTGITYSSRPTRRYEFIW